MKQQQSIMPFFSFVIRYSTLVILLAGCASAGMRQQRQEAQMHWNHVRAQIKLQLARQQYNDGHPKDTAHTAREVLSLDPATREAYLLLTRSYLETGDLLEAKRSLELAEQAGQTGAAFIYLHGVIAERRGELDQALNDFRLANEQDPANLDYLVSRVRCMVACGAPDAALQLVLKAGKDINNDGTIETLAAWIATLIGNTDSAMDSFRSAIRATGSPSLTLDYAMLLIEEGRYTEARVLLEPLLSDDVGDNVVDNSVDHVSDAIQETLRVALAKCDIALGDTGSALRVLAPYVNNKAHNGRAQLLVAMAALASGKNDLALSAAGKALKYESTRQDALLILAAVHLRSGRNQAAQKMIDAFLVKTPDDQVALALKEECRTTNE